MTHPRAITAATLIAVALFTACADPGRLPTAATVASAGANAAKVPSGPTVTATDPAESVRDTTLDVRVLGSGFDNGSSADFLLNGVPDPKVVTNSTRFVSSTEVVANVTIVMDAVPAYRDVAVTTSTGKKGIGTAKFQVLSPIVPAIPGSTSSMASGVNSGGVVVGQYVVSTASCQRRAFAWSEAGGTITLPIPTGYCEARAMDVNESGAILGYVWPTGGKPVAARWLPAGISTWTPEVLPLPGSGYSVMEAWRIDADGGVAVSWFAPSGVADAWVWSPGSGWTILAKPSTASCIPYGMNDAYQVVGNCSGISAYWSSPGATPVALPVPAGATNVSAKGINTVGIIVGAFTTGSGRNQVYHPSRWLPNGIGGWIQEDLTGVTGSPSDVNDEGVVIGSPPFVWSLTAGSIPLDPLRKNMSAFARSVSDRGTSGTIWIAGYGNDAGNTLRAMVWKR